MNVLRLLASISILALFFISCGNQSDSRDGVPRISYEKRAEYMAKGAEITKASFKALSSALRNSVAKHGIDSSIKMCNLKALPLTDSLQSALGVQIKRTALKLRNSKNAPTKEEKAILKLYKRAQEAGDSLRPVALQVDSNWVSFYSPILTQPMCLNCHGKAGVSMKESTYKSIVDLYPNDRAVDFKLEELRGMWSIKFKAN